MEKGKKEGELEKKHGEIISINETNIVCILNGGFTGKVGSFTTLQVLDFAGKGRVYMLLEKSFVFVEYQLVSDAIRLVGMDGTKHNGKVLHCTYVDTVPNEYIPKTLKIPGLFIYEDAISKELESRIINEITHSYQWSNLKDRQVMHFGKVYDYASYSVIVRDDTPPFPNFCKELLDIFNTKCNVRNDIAFEVLDQLTINKYEQGNGISPHVDSHCFFGENIVVFGLGASVAMEFNDGEGTKTEIIVPGRSLMIMSGPSRYKWTHGIRTRKVDLINGIARLRETRISLTLRNAPINPVCDCESRLCDGRKELMPSDEESNSKLKEFVCNKGMMK